MEMKSPKPDHSKGLFSIPIFWRLILMFLLIAGIVIAALMPLYYKALAISKESYLKENSQALNHSGVLFENMATTMWQIPQVMRQSQYYINVKLCHDKNITYPYYFYLSKVRELFSEQCLSYNIVDKGFILFMGSGLCVTNDRIFESAQECFSSYINYQGYESDAFVAKISNTSNQLTFLPDNGISIDRGQSSQYLTLLIHLTSDSAVYGILLSKQDILELFNIDTLPEGTFFYITNVTGDFLLSHNYDEAAMPLNDGVAEYAGGGGDYSVIRYEMASLGGEAVIGIPNGYFTQIVEPLSAMNSRYILAAVLIGIVLSASFAFVQFLPVRKLLKISLVRGYKEGPHFTNEYHILGQAMENASTEIRQLHNEIIEHERMFRSNLFIRLLYGTVHLGDELVLAARRITLLQSPCRVVVAHIGFTEGDRADMALCFRIYKQLSDQLSPRCVLAHLDPVIIAVLAADGEESLTLVGDAIRQAGTAMESCGVLLSAGGSEPFKGAEGVHGAFFQAQLGLDIIGYNSICYYHPSPDSDIARIVNQSDLQKLYELILAGEAGQAGDFISGIADEFSTSTVRCCEEVEQAFYAIRFTIESVIIDGKFQPGQSVLPSYMENKSVHALFNELRAGAETVARTLLERKNNTGLTFAKRIIAHIEEKIDDGGLCADSIVEHFGISRSYLYKVMKETTTKSVGEYIEIIRMKKACELLSNTQMSIGAVAAGCGYNTSNTFYKVFKKHFGITPSTYRSE